MSPIPRELVAWKGPTLSSQRLAFLDEAWSHIGKTCLWAQKGPSMFDCSGLVTYSSWATGGPDWRFDVNAAGLWDKCPHVGYFEAAPGDLVFYVAPRGDRRHVIHVTILLANWQVLSASGATSAITTKEAADRMGAKVRLHDSVWYRPGLIGFRHLPHL